MAKTKTQKEGAVAESPVKKKRKAWKIAVISVTVLLLAVIFTIAGFVLKLYIAASAVTPEEDPRLTDPDYVPDTIVDKEDNPIIILPPQGGDETALKRVDGIYNIVIGGTDGDGYRTDVIMLASFDTNKNTLKILSVPRDTYIATSRSAKKINSAYSYGKGPELIQKIEETFGVEVDYYAIVHLDTFEKIVDIIGGVEVNVADDMFYEDPAQDLYIDIKAGLQTLNGENAAKFVRYRSGYASADIARIEAQKVFLAAFAKQILKPGNILKLPDIITEVFKNLETNMALGDMISLALKAVKVDLANIIAFTLPGEGYVYKGGDYYTLYKEETLKLINMHFNPYDKELTEEMVSMQELGREENNKADYIGKSFDTLKDALSPKKTK